MRGWIVVGHRWTLSCVLLRHVLREHFCQQIEKICAAVKGTHFYLVVFLVNVILGDFDIEGSCEFHDYILHTKLVSETLCQMKSIADFHECHFLVAPFKPHILYHVLLRDRFDDDVFQVNDCFMDEVQCLCDKGGQRVVDLVALCFRLEDLIIYGRPTDTQQFGCLSDIAVSLFYRFDDSLLLSLGITKAQTVLCFR